MNEFEHNGLTKQWQIGDQIEGPEPDDHGVILAIEGCQLVISCGHGIMIYGRQKTMERMEWKLVHS